ncbi:MAG TPA: trypsin-like peptidase domain-containing protein [Phycisphaerae bacterium]|nr:trypsin-like peptidase domain-containing protein [Phycisphaerae bacterium]
MIRYFHRGLATARPRPNQWAWTALILLACAAGARADEARNLDALEQAERAEAARVAVVARITPAVVAIYDESERGGGSGVLLDPTGYGLTNFHVVADMLESRRGLGGLSDGKLYPLQVLGVDPGGDLAMFRLIADHEFPHAELGDSDTVRVGDEVLALGNPFLLSEDQTPTVTFGVVSGVNRYQWGAGANDTLLYSDCIQVDAAINPGNSGGPLFNLAGEVIGINGRISVSMRGRVNVGLGYAITANQIRMFTPALRAGLLAEHGTLEAVTRDHYDGSVIFTQLREDAPAWNAGIRPGDTLLGFDGRTIHSANEFASILGTLPANWPVPITWRRQDGVEQHAVARTEPIEIDQDAPFEVNTTVNLDAVERVLLRFQAASFDAPALADWDVTGDSSSPLAAQALAVAVRAHGADFSRSAMADLKHAGADRIVRFDGDQPVTSPPLECVTADLGDNATARMLFDPASGALLRIRAVDALTHEEVILDRRTDPDASLRLAADASDPLPPDLAAVAARTVKLVGARVGQAAGYGCGILVSSNGLVLTVDSALLDGRHVRAYLNDGSVRGVQSVRADHDQQLALLQLVAEGESPGKYPYFDLSGDQPPAPRGESVWAGGNPFKVASGAEPISFARGTLSTTTRLDATRGTQDLPYRGRVLVIDAITSTPGFAGGPLVNAGGRILGMIGRIAEARMTHTMLNYAVPADVLASFLAAATAPAGDAPHDTAARKPGYHGIKFFELGYRENPVYVERVRRGSPAARAGLRTDDLIIGADGKPVPNLETLTRLLDGFGPGDTVTFTVMRKKEIHKFEVTLEEEP